MVVLAVAALFALLWGVGTTATVRADNLDVCLSGCSYTTIQDAISAAEDGDTIRVAAGVYSGTMACDVWGVGLVTNTLCITEDLTLLGGYNPVDFGVRDPDQYPTIVQWEGEPGNSAIALVNGTEATVDGFEITGAAGAAVGAISIRDSAPTISHNRIVGNSSLGHGGGISVGSNSTATIESNVILSNTAEESGGGIAVRLGATALISGNLIAYNEAISNGGGLFVEGAVVTITHNQFLSNTVADNGGGGALVEHGSTFLMGGNTFQGNSAGCCGGGVGAWWDTTGTIVGNLFEGNTALVWNGGGIFLSTGSFDVLSNTVTANQATQRLGGGIGILGESTRAILIGNSVISNAAQTGGGGISIDWGPNVHLKSNRLLSNTVQSGLGSGLRIVDAEALVERNLIAYGANETWIYGDGALGVAADGPSEPVTITNNVIVDNADKGMMVTGEAQGLTVVNNTIASNRNEGVLAYDLSTVSLLRNNLIVSNGGCGIAADEGAEYGTIDYNDVWNNGDGNWNYCDYGNAAVPPAPGPGSLSVDPQFVDAAAGDYHLAQGSPAINAGTPAGAPPDDRDGVPRPQMGGVDMGAYERVSSSVFLPAVMRNAAPAPAREWLIETVDTDGYSTPAIALDQDQQPHMTYACSGGMGSLCYAVKSGSQWVIETVNTLGGEVSLALDTADQPHISSGNGSLSYAHFDGSSWAVEPIEANVGDGMGRNSALALDAGGQPHITYYGPQTTSATQFWHAFYDGDEWVKEPVAGDAWGDGRGVSSGLRSTPGAELHAIYQSGAVWAFNVSYAHYDGHTWSTQVIASGSGGSLTMAADGSLHVSFVSGSHVRYGRLQGSQWILQDVADFGTPYPPRTPLGFVLDGATSIQMDTQNRPHIAFYNQLDWDRGQLCYARFDGSQWIVEVVDTEGAPGFGQLSLALDTSDKAHIAYYDLVNDEVRYAHLK
jgi:hypothetical protein